MILRLTIAALMILATGADACAEPITAALFGAAFASTLLGSVVTFIFTAAAMVGGSLLLNAIKPKPKASTDTGSQPGIQFDVQMGDDVPIGFTVGTTGTAGTRKYIGTWGQDGATPNAYLTDVIQIGDLPAPGELGLWINDTYCTIEWDAAPTPQGYPVTEFRVNGRDHLWVQYRDGTQTDADPFLLSKFGTHPDMPWKATMIGRGCPYFTMTALFNRELFNSGSFSYLAEPPETPWYDVRKDSTAGGDGAHRWNDPSTWEPTSNNAVIIYNLVRGVYYGDEWVYGGQDLAAFRLPADNMMAAQNECDADRELEDDETEPQYRCGMEIRGDMEPLTVIAELLKGCSGRMAEVGGIFKLLIGAPGSAVYAFTDADILVTRGQSLMPFPTIDDTHNGLEATYPEPEERWATKDAPARYSETLEAADDGHRLVTGVHFAAAPFAIQVQQLMRAMVEEARRFRTHSFHLPPDAYPLEPLDVVAYSSVRNSYLNKKFLVLKIVGERTANQLVLLKEINPSDYGLPPDQQLPVSTGPIASQRPPAQPMVGWQAFPATNKDANGIDRRPSVQIQFDGNQDDVRAVRVQVRLAGDPALVFDGELPYGAPSIGIRLVVLNAVLLPATAYEARGIFVPYSGRETTWSSWLAVTTPDVRLSSGDLEDGIKDYVTRQLPAQLRQINFATQRIAQLAADQDAQNEMLNRAVRTLLSANGVTISETVQIALGVNGKLTGAVFNTIDNNGFITGTYHYNDGTEAPFTIVATDFFLAAPGINGGEPVPVFKIGTSGGEANVVLHGNIIGDGEIKAHHIEVESITAINANLGNASVTGTLTGGPSGMLIQDFTLGNIIALGT